MKQNLTNCACPVRRFFFPAGSVTDHHDVSISPGLVVVVVVPSSRGLSSSVDPKPFVAVGMMRRPIPRGIFGVFPLLDNSSNRELCSSCASFGRCSGEELILGFRLFGCFLVLSLVRSGSAEDVVEREEDEEAEGWVRRLLCCRAAYVGECAVGLHRLFCELQSIYRPPELLHTSKASPATPLSLTFRVLMLSKGTAAQKSFLVPLLALGEYGAWAAFLALLVRFFFYIPGELELPFTVLLLVIVAPHQVIKLIRTQEGAIISVLIAVYLGYHHFSRTGLQRAFDQGSVVATIAVICKTAASLLLVL